MPAKGKMVHLALGAACVVTILVGLVVWLLPPEGGASSLPQPQAKGRPLAGDPQHPTITICALRDHSIEVALELLKESNFEEQVGIRVEAILLEFEPMVRAHELDFAKGNGAYDLVSIDQPSLGRYVTRGWVRPLAEFMSAPSLPSLDVEDIIPVLRQACGEWDGGYYAIPLGSYGALLAYRTDVLSAAGLGPPTSFAEFIAHARTMNAPPNLYGTALFAHEGEYITADTAPFLWSWGAGLINGCDVHLPGRPKHRVVWDTPEGIAALKFYASLYREGLAPPDTLNFDHARYIGAFQSGKVAMGIMPAEGIGAPMEDPAASEVVGKIAYANLPGRKRADGTMAPPRPGLGAHSLAITQHSKHPREAYLVLQFLTGADVGSEYIRRGGRPFRKSHFSQDAIDLYPYMAAMRDGMATGRCRPNIPEYPAVSKIFFTAFHSALKHGADIEAVMRAAARKANEDILIPAYPKNVEVLPGGAINE
jgi:multiple sugar transport system substrate-binding protein